MMSFPLRDLHAFRVAAWGMLHAFRGDYHRCVLTSFHASHLPEAVFETPSPAPELLTQQRYPSSAPPRVTLMLYSLWRWARALPAYPDLGWRLEEDWGNADVSQARAPPCCAASPSLPGPGGGVLHEEGAAGVCGNANLRKSDSAFHRTRHDERPIVMRNVPDAARTALRRNPHTPSVSC